MPAVPSWLIEPLWAQFEALIPARAVTHPLGCHRPRVPDRVVFDKLVQLLVFGVSYVKIADDRCSASTIRRRRDEWITAGIFAELERIALAGYDKMVGLDLADLAVDGCIVKARAAATPPHAHRWIGANKAPNARCWSTDKASRSAR